MTDQDSNTYTSQALVEFAANKRTLIFKSMDWLSLNDILKQLLFPDVHIIHQRWRGVYPPWELHVWSRYPSRSKDKIINFPTTFKEGICDRSLEGTPLKTNMTRWKIPIIFMHGGFFSASHVSFQGCKPPFTSQKKAQPDGRGSHNPILRGLTINHGYSPLNQVLG